MRLESVRLVNFGSHASRTWEPGTARLSVIVGPNGAGKSTLLVDGPLFALFGEVPDGSSPDQLVRIGSTDMSVTIELVLDGIRYRIIRRRTTRAGGKSSADLQAQAPNGSWMPVASGAREVTAEATRLLRMDQSTFRTAVILAQRDAHRFMMASPGKGTATAPGRAATLSTIVVDPRFALAEVATREEARDVEASIAADRRAIAILDESLAHRPEFEADARTAAEAETDALAAIAVADVARNAAEASLRELAGRLAEAKAAADELARIDAERATLIDRYRRARDGADAARSAIARTKVAAEAEIAPVDIDVIRAALEAAEGAERNRQARKDQLEAVAADLRTVELTHERDVAAWRTKHAAAAGLVASLEEQGRSLAPVTCPKCRHRFAADPGDVAGRLDAARAALAAVGSQPAEPFAIGRARAAVARTEQALVESPADPEGLAAARRAVVDAERVAGAIAARDQARAALAEAEASLTRAEAELAEAERSGRALATSRTAAAERAAGQLVLDHERIRLEVERSDAIAQGTAAARAHTAAIDAAARAGAALAALERDQATRDQTVGKVAGGEHRLGILRRLVAAFGVKGIPARVIEGVLPELVAHANEMLGQLRPGMNLDIRATRTKADGSGTIEALDIWIRDEHGERQRWSGGEATSIAMSIAIALSRLGARRSGARVATLVIDEPDGLDSESRRAFGQALRLLAHRGDLERVAVITHQDGIPDFADDVVEIERDEEPAGSGVEQIA